MRKFFESYLHDESGASAAEYALILAVVCAGIVGAAILLGKDITTAIDDVANVISNSAANMSAAAA